MPKRRRGAGIQSAAGLVRYFEEEEAKGPLLDPRYVVFLAILAGISVALAYKLWPY
ncbi:MAG TPA: preprotein translocase subunit Sec61beta [Aciduliprofundum sp.]|nr:preprotein translocase subunit Sec61beta [Aciduliprofundum sp.]